MAANTAPTPELTPFARALSERILRDGPITVADFMAEAAGEYYARNAVFGRDGDFTTAPEISQLFGEMVAVWLTDLWLQMGKPDSVQLVELGPGRGTLTADIMRTLRTWPDFRNAVSLHLVETSPGLRETQARALSDCQPTWYDRIEDVPQGMCFIIANEFLDALPIHQFEKIDGQWQERRVDFDVRRQEFIFTHAPAGLPVQDIMPPAFMAAPDNSVFEVSPASLSVVEHITSRLKRAGGGALFIDYGHSRTGLGDTLQALEKHQYAPALGNPGGRDITAHVDFATCAAAAEAQAQVHGPVTQAEFLSRLGIMQRAQKLYEGATEQEARDLQAALYRLVGSTQMGNLFKVMALTPKDATINPAGFGDDAGDAATEEEEAATHG